MERNYEFLIVGISLLVLSITLISFLFVYFSNLFGVHLGSSTKNRLIFKQEIPIKNELTSQIKEQRYRESIIDKPLLISTEEMKQNLPSHIDISEVNLLEEIIQDKDKISIKEICEMSSLNEEKVVEISLNILGRKRYFGDIVSANYFWELTGKK